MRDLYRDGGESFSQDTMWEGARALTVYKLRKVSERHAYAPIPGPAA